MKFLTTLLLERLFGDLNRSISSLAEIRDSYRQGNVEVYGEELARILNDW